MCNRIRKRLVSGLVAAVMAVSNTVPIMTHSTETETETTTVTVMPTTASASETEPTDPSELSHQSIELYPNGEDAQEVVSLEGLMPEGATAEAVDVSEEHDGVAAYDITITDGDEEFQPDGEHPILVEITDPAIPEGESVELWHIHDDGTREQMFDFTCEEGRITFYATGFSVYEIVTNENVKPLPDNTDTGWKTISGVADLANYGEGSDGLYISHTGGFYFKDSIDDTNNRKGIAKTKIGEKTGTNTIQAIELGAAKYYFEQVNENDTTKYYVYCIKKDQQNNPQKYYILNEPENSLDLSTSNKTAFIFSEGTYKGVTGIKAQSTSHTTKYWNMQADENGNRFCAYSFNQGGTYNFWYYVPLEKDPYKLNNESYGLMQHNTNGAAGNALMANGTTGTTSSKFSQLVMLDADHHPREFYVPSDVDITEWTFLSTTEDLYKLRAGEYYLKASGTSLILTDAPDDATEFQVIPNTNNSIRLKYGSSYVHAVTSADGSEITGFDLASTATDLWFARQAAISTSDLVTYTARRISVSDGSAEAACNGAELIVYTRIWDDENKKYDFYAIDHNGTLCQVYAYGDKIMWQDDTMNTLLWKFTVYYNDDGTENGYYELQNTHSDKFIAPQLVGKQTLSDSKIGILMQGRKYEVDGDKTTYGEYYSNIIAWDKSYKQYAALACDVENGSITTTSLALGETFYFAIPDNITNEETEARLHSVTTVDNTQYGITMRMIDFDPNNGDKGKAGSSVTQNYFKGFTENTKGLLSESLNENGHPTIAKTNDASAIPIGTDFGAAFENAYLTNHLFISSIHESSGYFEYDSCQNFATLVPNGALVQQTKDNVPMYVDADGKLTSEQYVKDENNNPTSVENEKIYDFTVYRELGTSESNGTTRQHGQFLPYNYIKPATFSTLNPKNMYSVNALYGDAVKGLLSDDDPRKYEDLYKIFRWDDATNKEIAEGDFYIGMELEAEFVQTPSGLDAWGHDVIFEFTGDDDFWLYVDGELVLDLGGIHSAESGKVNFRTGKVDYATYSNNTLVEHHTTLKQLFTEHYQHKTYTEDEAKERILTRDCNADRNITLDEYQSKYPTAYNEARYAYVTENPDATEEKITEYLTSSLANRKITYDEYKSLYPNACDYDTLLAAYQTLLHDATSTTTYINNLFTYNDEPDPANQGYVFNDYTTHKMKVYYMERGAGASNLHMRFNLSAVTPGNVLFAKTLSNVSAADDMDTNLVQYPFQIFYKYTDNEQEPWIPLTDKDDSGNINVSYQNSTQTVRYARSYTPASGAKTYENVFFLTPGKNIEISFPDDAMYYYVVECAVNSDIYDLSDPTANNGTVHLETVEVSGNIKELKTKASQVSALPTIAFENKMKDGMIRTLNIKKQLYNENYIENGSKEDNADHVMHYNPNPEQDADITKVDNTLFNFRLYFWDEVKEDWVPADMQRYYIVDRDGDLSVWHPDETDPTIGWYEKYNIGTKDNPVYVKDPTTLTEAQKTEVTVVTSRFGAIADIPAGYTVKVPGLIAETRFRVEERDYEIPVGYDLIDYVCSPATEDGTETDNSYLPLNNMGLPDDSAGKILSTSDAYMTISNRRGFGLEADKIWSDADFASSHDPIYVAVYRGNDLSDSVLVDGTVRQLVSAENPVKYFFKQLDAGYTLNQYHIYEVAVTDPVLAAHDPTDTIIPVTGYTNVVPYADNTQMTDFPVTDLDGQTVNDDYIVCYAVGTPTQTGESGGANVRVDKIHNKRKGGIEINLYQWNTNTDPQTDIPLEGGTFRIYRYQNNSYSDLVGEYVSDRSGLVTVLYGLTMGEKYMVEEVLSPRGFIGMAQPVYFTVTASGTAYSINEWSNANDPAEDNDNAPSDGKNWAEYTLNNDNQIMAAKIDIYNKPFTLEMKKIDGGTKTALEGVEFQLFKDTMILGVLRKGFDPIAGYESLITDANGIIPKIDNTLQPLENKKYYLHEEHTKEGYALLEEDIVFTVSDLGIITCDNEDLLERKEEQVGNTLKVTYTISIPNTTAASDYYFDIEKILLVDKNVHDSDTEQQFLFRVDRFKDEDALDDNKIEETFYVSLNCDEELLYTSDADIKYKKNSAAYPYELYREADTTGYPQCELQTGDAPTVKVKKTYNAGTASAPEITVYTYPAAIWCGRRTIHVFKEGIYRVSEEAAWSSTDEDFWSGSNDYKGYGTPISEHESNGYVIFDIKAVEGNQFEELTAEINGHTFSRPTASFTNSESEYAYLSSQAFADNTIKH